MDWKIGASAVASVGAAGMFMWLSNGLATLAKMGGQIKVGHALGAQKKEDATSYAQSSIQMGIVFAIGFGILSVVFADEMIGFFQLNSAQVIQDAKLYLMITCGLVIFSFMNQIFTGILTAMGNSRTSFIATGIGLVLNIVLDPLFIFGFGVIHPMGVAGAAIATVLAQLVVMLLFLYTILRDTVLFCDVHILHSYSSQHTREIFRIGLPSAVQSMLFSGISMVIARLIAGWGDAAVAVQKVGSQIESISWMTAEGYAAALNSFVAQNHGAKNTDRIREGYRLSMIVMLSFCSDRFSTAHLSGLYPGSRGVANGGGLSSDSWCLSVVYVYGNHNSGCLQRTWKNAASIHCKYHVNRRTNTDGDIAGKMAGSEWRLVGNYD